MFVLTQRALSTSSESSVEDCGSTVNKQMARNGHPEKKAKTTAEKLKSTKKDDTAEAATAAATGKEVKKPIKTTTVKDFLRAKRDSMRNMVDGRAAASSDEAASRSGSSDESDSDDDNDDDDDEDEDGGDDNDNDEMDDGGDDDDDVVDDNADKMDGTDQPAGVFKKDALNGVAAASPSDEKLPNNLPAVLVSYIHKLIESAKCCTGAKTLFDSKNTEFLYQ